VLFLALLGQREEAKKAAATGEPEKDQELAIAESIG
jgi:hypothetical protein